MKKWLKYTIIYILALPLFACENYEPELYRNTPEIKDVKFSGIQKTQRTIDMTVTITLNKSYGDQIFVQVGNLHPENFEVSSISDNIYKHTYNLRLSDFDKVDYSTGSAIFNNMNVAIKSKDYPMQTLASYLVGGLRYQERPSINISEVEKERTYYDSGRYHSEYTYWFEVKGSIFLKDVYRYLIGNWSEEGKGSSLYAYGPEYGMQSNSASINYLYSMTDTLYLQLRGETGDNTEITSNYTVRFIGTGSGDCNISLVWSSSVPATYTRSSNGSAVHTATENAPTIIKHGYRLCQEPIEMTYDR